jgi:hypothetical protein
MLLSHWFHRHADGDVVKVQSAAGAEGHVDFGSLEEHSDGNGFQVGAAARAEKNLDLDGFGLLLVGATANMLFLGPTVWAKSSVRPQINRVAAVSFSEGYWAWFLKASSDATGMSPVEVCSFGNGIFEWPCGASSNTAGCPVALQ